MSTSLLTALRCSRSARSKFTDEASITLGMDLQIVVEIQKIRCIQHGRTTNKTVQMSQHWMRPTFMQAVSLVAVVAWQESHRQEAAQEPHLQTPWQEVRSARVAVSWEARRHHPSSVASPVAAA